MKLSGERWAIFEEPRRESTTIGKRTLKRKKNRDTAPVTSIRKGTKVEDLLTSGTGARGDHSMMTLL